MAKHGSSIWAVMLVQDQLSTPEGTMFASHISECVTFSKSEWRKYECGEHHVAEFDNGF